jgi:TonB family protein
MINPLPILFNFTTPALMVPNFDDIDSLFKKNIMMKGNNTMKGKRPNKILILSLFLSIFLHAFILFLPFFKNYFTAENSEISVLIYTPSKSGEDKKITKSGKNAFSKERRESPEKETSSIEEGWNGDFSEENKESFQGGNEFVKGDGFSGDSEYGKGGGIPDELLKKVERNKFYPREALRNMIEGDVILSFDVSENGYVKELRVEGSSGSIYLDRAAIECIKKSQPLPPVSHRVTLILRYRIKK